MEKKSITSNSLTAMKKMNFLYLLQKECVDKRSHNMNYFFSPSVKKKSLFEEKTLFDYYFVGKKFIKNDCTANNFL